VVTPNPHILIKVVVVPNTTHMADAKIALFLVVIIFTAIGLAVYEFEEQNIPYVVTNITIYNETPAITTYQITVDKGTIVYSIKVTFTNITSNLQCNLTPDPPIRGPAVIWLTCPTGHVEEIDIVTSNGTAQYPAGWIGQASETVTYQP
jgi:hypothetical protein